MIGNDDLKKPLISVIINCYNGEEFLKEAIDSVFGQTYSNWEIVFWDNCSTDQSAAIAKSYGEKVKYFRSNSNVPLGQARNFALQKANGKFITFVDCDDIWSKNKLEKQLHLMIANPDFILCYGSIEEITLQKVHFRNVITLYDSGYIFKELLLQYDINILTSMINADLLRNSELEFDPVITASEEYCLFMQLASTHKIGVLKDILAQYRVHSNSLTSKSLSKLGFERRHTLNRILNQNPFLEKKYHYEFKEAYARSNYYDSRWHMLNSQKLKAFKCMRKIAFVNKRYFILFILTILPSYFWNKVHMILRNRQ